ncbi:MAG: FAD-binding oxidoreductase [Acidimicrobiales bacterium]
MRGQTILSRRQLLQVGAAGALGGVLGWLGPPGYGASASVQDRRPVPLGPGARTEERAGAPSRAAWDALACGLAGRLSRPGDPSYLADHELYNPLFDGTHPAGVAFCASPSDVARTIVFARQHGLALAVRSGRHSYGGYSTTTGLVADVSAMSRVSVRGKAKAVVGAGAQLIDVYSVLSRQGVSIPAGSCATVGMAGLTLGGGIGVMDRLHGLTCDNLTDLELVTAAGDVVRADAATNAELFWACRGGGGGNFGVVTEMGFNTFPIGELALFALDWPWPAAAQVLSAWLGWSSRAPDEMWSTCQLATVPGGPSPTVRVAGVWAGAPSGAAAHLARLTGAGPGAGASGAGTPTGQYLAPSSFEQAMYVEAGCQGLSEAACHIAGHYPGGTLPRSVEVAKSDIFVRPLSDPGVKAVLAGIEERQAASAPGAVIFDSWGGAVNRVAPRATAFVHRSAIASAQYIAMLPASASLGAISSARAWLDAWYESLRPYASGQAYQNYIDPSLRDWARAYYGENLPRLGEVKAKWDPDDVWHFAQSIPLPKR